MDSELFDTIREIIFTSLICLAYKQRKPIQDITFRFNNSELGKKKISFTGFAGDLEVEFDVESSRLDRYYGRHEFDRVAEEMTAHCHSQLIRFRELDWEYL